MSADRETRERNKSEFGWEKIADSVNRASDVAKSGRDARRRANIDQSTVPDAFGNMPMLISPRVPRLLDVGVAGYFLGLGDWFASRRKGGVYTAAFVNCAMVAGVALFTDYDGDG